MTGHLTGDARKREAERHDSHDTLPPMEEVNAMLDDGPECETCGKTTCPDAQLASFSNPVACEYAPAFRELRDALDCDYGCARDWTNTALRRGLVPAVEALIEARLADYTRRIQAEALRAARDAWESEDPDALMRLAEEHYRVGGPSMPAIYLGLRADRIENEGAQ